MPTPVQDQSIRQIMQGKDLLGVANTGTGKTGAFLIPLFEKIVKNRKEKVLVIVPTRELAEQINDEFFILSRNLRIFSVACIGGNYIGKQIYQLKKGYNFVIGTPGRLIDLNKRGELNMGGFSTIVLDEVDRMLEMGFIDDIKFLIEQLPEKRQSLFFSATINPKVENVINLLFKKEYAKVSVRTGETAENVNQDIVRYGSPSDKLDKLTELLEGKDLEKVLIFVNTKRFVDKLEEILLDRGYKVESIHGDKRQSQRRKSITNFKTGNSKILIATDVAARGLDINGVSHVINYDIPDNFEDYIHRIGRTGRANHLGTALTFVEHRQTAKY